MTPIRAAQLHFDNLASQYDAYAERRAAYLGRLDALVCTEMERNNARSLLDVGCGTGRLLARVSHEIPNSVVEGLDVSSRMVALSRRRGVEAKNTDFMAHRPRHAYDAIAMTWNVFGFLSAQCPFERVLERAISLLSPSGIFVFDAVNAHCLTYANLLKSAPTSALRAFTRVIRPGPMEITCSVRGAGHVSFMVVPPGR